VTRVLLILVATLAALPGQQKGDENSASWHRQMAQIHHEAGRIEQTLEHLQKAIRLDPTNEQYYLDLGEVLAQNNAREAVVVVFEAAQKALPNSFRMQSALGVAYLGIRNYEQAKQVFTALVRVKPDHEQGYQLLAECYDITRDWENTAITAEALRKLNPKNSNGWYYGASAEFGMRKPRGESLQTALALARRAAQLAPRDWRPYLLLGKMLAESGEDTEAVTALQKAIALHSQDPKTYYILGQTLKRLGREQESAAAFQAYKEAHTNHAAQQRSLIVEIK
jgi:Flp pilus assembly protein TadD